MSSKAKCPFVARRGRIPEQFVGTDANDIIDGFSKMLKSSDIWNSTQIVSIGAASGAGLSSLISELSSLAALSGFLAPMSFPSVASSKLADVVYSIVLPLLLDENCDIPNSRLMLLDDLHNAKTSHDFASLIVKSFSCRFDGIDSPALFVGLDDAAGDGGVTLHTVLRAVSDISVAFPSSRIVIVAGDSATSLVNSLMHMPTDVDMDAFEQSFYLLRRPAVDTIADWYASVLSMSGIDGAYDDNDDVSLLISTMAEAACGDDGSLLLAQAIGAAVWKSGKKTGRITARDIDEAIKTARKRIAAIKMIK